MRSTTLKISFSNLSHVLVLFIAIGLLFIGIGHMAIDIKLPPVFIWGLGLAAYCFTISDVFNGKGRGMLHVIFLYLGSIITVIAILFPIAGINNIDYLKNRFVEGLTIVAIAVIFITFAFKAIDEEIAKINELAEQRKTKENEGK